ncbi:MAG TPA: acetamidase/formamidase family protein [Aggregatilineales bacterium]|nr:acetamidase/formamidase family protein [Aggregatilineales bacterium]
MKIHRFTPTHYFNTIGSHEPVLHIAPGDTVITTTVDAHGQDAADRTVTAGPNPMTGPFYIEGAEPGDTLVVRIERLIPNRATGWGRPGLAHNVVDPTDVAALPSRQELAIWRIDPVQGRVYLQEPMGKLGAFSLPLQPMIGCFGVAPADGQAISTATSGEYGGNMDYNGYGEGVTAYFPVFQPGALFHLGDGHAWQGDGEISGTGVETSFEMQFSVDLRKGQPSGWPRGENATHIFTAGNARPLDQAVQHATSEMLRWLQADYGFSAQEANLLLGYAVEYSVGNMFDPAYTMICKIAKRYLKG